MVELTFAIEGAEVDRICGGAISHSSRYANCQRAPGVPGWKMCCCTAKFASSQRAGPIRPKNENELTELFGVTHRWKDTLQSIYFRTHINVQVCRPSMVSASSNCPVPCSFDFNVAATKYFFGLEGGEVPLALLFSGTVFYRDAGGFSADGPDLLEQGSELPAPGAGLARADGTLLSQHGVAARRSRGLRGNLPLQEGKGLHRLR